MAGRSRETRRPDALTLFPIGRPRRGVVVNVAGGVLALPSPPAARRRAAASPLLAAAAMLPMTDAAREQHTQHRPRCFSLPVSSSASGADAPCHTHDSLAAADDDENGTTNRARAVVTMVRDAGVTDVSFVPLVDVQVGLARAPAAACE